MRLDKTQGHRMPLMVWEKGRVSVNGLQSALHAVNAVISHMFVRFAAPTDAETGSGTLWDSR